MGYMDTKPKSTPELLLEAEEAHCQADMTIGLGESILQNAREMKRKVESRFRQVAEGIAELEETTAP